MSWIIILLLIPFAFSAQTQLEAIEVTATKDMDRFTFSSSETLHSYDLEKLPMGLTSEAIGTLPGIVQSQNGGPGGRVAFFIRGTESRHVSFTLDGLRINDTSNTDRQFDAAFLTSSFIKEMSVYKGAQAVLYGPDALGGLIDLKTRKGESAPETRLSVNVGSFGTIESSLSSDWKESQNQGTVTLSRFHSDGISRLNKKRFDANEKDATDITQVTSSSRHQWHNKISTDFLISYLHGKAEQDGFASDNSYDLSLNDQYIIQQKTNYELNNSQAISIRNGFNRHQRHNKSLTLNSEFFDGNLIQHEFIHRLDRGKSALISGLSTEHESAKAIDMDRSFDLNSAFIQSSFMIKELKFQSGGRLDKHSRYGTFKVASAGVSLGDFSLQYSQGYKTPSLYQLYGPDSFGAPVGNPDLVPETSHSWELSWKTISEYFNGGVSLFQNRLANQFTYSFTEGYLNQQRFIAEGIELDAQIKTTSFEFSSSFTHQEFRNEDSPVLRRPKNMAKLGVSYFPAETIELNVTENWFSSRKDIGISGLTKLNSYEVTDFSIRKTWDHDDVSLSFRNIFNRNYEEIYGFSVMPRSMFLHYGHRF
jgi:vitamin B12 transporter